MGEAQTTKDRRTGGRAIHISTAFAVAALAGLSFKIAPELWKDTAASFSSTGGFLTLYGVIFAVIEAMRAKAAAELAAIAAKSASRAVATMYGLRSVTECQTQIRTALTDLEKNGSVSAAVLARVLELYTAEFHIEYQNPQSTERLNVAELQSHAGAAGEALKPAPKARLGAVLRKMLADIAARGASKMNEGLTQ